MPLAALAAGLALTCGVGALIRTAGIPALQRTNFRRRRVLLVGPAAATGLAVGALVAAADEPRVGIAAVVAVVVAAGAGLADDVWGDADAKGLRGHLGALLRGRLTTGGAKLLAIAGAGLLAAALTESGWWRTVVAGGVVAGTANLVNLFDLRPGRAVKVTLVACAVLAVVGAGLLAAVGGVSLALLPADAAERTMLGDGGANPLGAALGVALVARAGSTTALGWLLLVITAATLLSEWVSFSRVIDRVPPLRWADGLGRRR